jgi:hypothetical protein
MMSDDQKAKQMLEQISASLTRNLQKYIGQPTGIEKDQLVGSLKKEVDAFFLSLVGDGVIKPWIKFVPSEESSSDSLSGTLVIDTKWLSEQDIEFLLKHGFYFSEVEY